MGRIIVEVMPKPEILDPQGKAVGSALPRLGITSFEAVRQGKCFHLTVDGPVTDELLEQAHSPEGLSRRRRARLEAHPGASYF
ncbi:phosphoribosylformylglycinamidine synthase subunit PurS [Actinomyces bouchesdurhonensis]|uniref:phosphoribosylformylglycinamidine synthase subunit PurS n=1 Tax=Actinomyces bouchesdurhonensis TaxID=1852361 RepID=UPI000939F20C|nr:phosphoribosylformylglycinamidine synthase subunit PurS [Actinomyces bouchesdurhonensis]